MIVQNVDNGFYAAREMAKKVQQEPTNLTGDI